MAEKITMINWKIIALIWIISLILTYISGSWMVAFANFCIAVIVIIINYYYINRVHNHVNLLLQLNELQEQKIKELENK